MCLSLYYWMEKQRKVWWKRNWKRKSMLKLRLLLISNLNRLNNSKFLIQMRRSIKHRMKRKNTSNFTSMSLSQSSSITTSKSSSWHWSGVSAPPWWLEHERNTVYSFIAKSMNTSLTIAALHLKRESKLKCSRTNRWTCFLCFIILTGKYGCSGTMTLKSTTSAERQKKIKLVKFKMTKILTFKTIASFHKVLELAEIEITLATWKISRRLSSITWILSLKTQLSRCTS